MKQEKWEWIKKYLVDELEADEAKAFDEWRQSDIKNELLVEKFSEFWKSGKPYPALSDDDFLKKIESDPQANWQKIMEETNPEAQVIKMKPSTYQWIYKIAASVVLIVGIGYWFNAEFGTLNRSTVESQLLVAQSGDNVRELTLYDGSVVWLSPGSSLSYPENFDAATRTVVLTGEGFFDIARNEQQPFIVNTTTSQVKVLGTSFNVNSLDADKTMVSVVSGLVSLAANSALEQNILLKKGDVGELTASQKLIKYEITDDNFLSWKTGVLSFSNSSIIDVIEAISKHYRVSIDLPNGVINDKRITATFDNQPIEDVLDVIETMHGFKFVVSKSSPITIQ